MIGTREIRADALLGLTAVIWGTAFVAQRVGMDYVGPFTYSGVRFCLGWLVLFPLLIHEHKTRGRLKKKPDTSGLLIIGGFIAGVFLFLGVNFQQVGLVYTTAGKAGFITGLYVVIVPIMGLFWGQHTNAGTWMGAFLAAAGLYFLSIKGDFSISFGDLLVMIGAFIWAGHVLIIGWLSPKIYPIDLAFFQLMVCSVLSLIFAVIFEEIHLDALIRAAVPIGYGGIFSVGIAYTLQVVAQRTAPPAHAAIILSLETVCAAVAGIVLLNETLNFRGVIGCCLMFTGMIISQLWGKLDMLHIGNKSEQALPGEMK